ncbi:MAG: FtsX-like permease family protein [Oscillospiraceae bacterium]|jgi:hypothetical protein|nr:FtsX-like permease family protein [Oscillospiraceae bacterium]
MRILKISLKQIIRTPVKVTLFFLLLAFSVCLLILGMHLWTAGETQMQIIETGFSTIATVQQIPNMIKTESIWFADSRSHSIFNYPVYDKIVQMSVMSFDGADYIHNPEHRPYYGAYVPNYIISDNEFVRIASMGQIIIAEIQPLEDSIPSVPIRVSINKVLHGNLDYMEEIWFCNLQNENPPKMEAGKTYIVSITPYPWYMGSIEPNEDIDIVYIPARGIYSTQFDRAGNRIVDKENSNKLWDEVTENYYITPRGLRWLSLIEGLNRLTYTIPVTPTNSTNLLMPFFTGDTLITEGRDISEDEYLLGERVCIIPRYFAVNNDLVVGDKIELPLYFANYARNAALDYYTDGWGRPLGSIINVNGEVYPVFDSGHYTIVGIYDTFGNTFGTRAFGMGGNEVIVPSAAIKNNDENNILGYRPMQSFNTSFQIQNGTIESFTELWNQQNTDNLEILFYDKGYSEIKSGLELIRNSSIVLLSSGTAVTIIVLLFFVHLFVSKQQKRTAIERSMGMSKTHCGLSLVTGVMVITILGSTIGGTIGFLLATTVQLLIVFSMQNQLFDTQFSNWANTADVAVTQEQIKYEQNSFVFVALIVAVNLVAIGFVLFGIYTNFRKEPLAMLSIREE